ncbi:MAG TPA: di-heme oxidoredictase family protein [Thermoanaerobaculia bacterium]|nr:di-heme oxidoredictase family protein [Thermoanaerobaculia bacterium]
MGSRVSYRSIAASLLLLGSLALVPTSGTSPPDFGEPLRNLTPDQLARFDAGKDEFNEVETPEEGLGPVFNDVSCGTCHSAPAIGGGSDRLETRFGRLRRNGQFDPLTQFGGSLIQEQGIGVTGACEYLAETVPPEATIVAKRRTTPLFGLGLVDAVPDAVFQQIAFSERNDSDRTGGIVSVVTNLATGLPAVGKFGWKDQNPSLFQFAGDAYVNEMGITSPQFPNENCPGGNCDSLSCNPMPTVNDDGSGVQAFADFMTFLAPPPRGPIPGAAILGEHQFNSIGCANCHLATLRTGRNSVAALDQVTFHPYSDFLLHDMGSLGDGITQNRATGRLMRTAPLWGVRKQTTLLHDGRATTLMQAILAHDGQARRSRDRFTSLSSFEKAQLLAFLNSL